MIVTSCYVVSAPGVRGVAEHARREEMGVAVPDPGHLQTDTVDTVTLGNVFKFVDKEASSSSSPYTQS